MHIAVDARELGGNLTGVGTYLAHLLEQWMQLAAARAHRWTLYVPEVGPRCEAGGGGEAGFERRIVPGGPSTWWEQTSLARALRRDRPDVLFAPGYTAPLAISTPVALTVHDVSFFAHPDWFRAREGFRRRLLTRWSAQKARAIVTVSEFSKLEIVRWLGVPETRVRVIPHGISIPISVPAAASRPPVVLYVGSIFKRRRVPDLIRAFVSVLSRVPDARLEIVGENRTQPREDLDGLARSLGASNRVMVRSYVPDDQLASLYGQARVFAFLSEYEGFGFTPLEALAHSVPIVLLDTPVAREVYGDAALYVAAGDLAATAAALERLLLDEAVRATQLGHATVTLRRYFWPETARRTLEAIEQAGARA